MNFFRDFILIFLSLLFFLVIFIKYIKDKKEDSSPVEGRKITLTPAQVGKFVMGDFVADRLVLGEILYLVYKGVYSISHEEYTTPVKKKTKTNFILTKLKDPWENHTKSLVKLLEDFKPTSTKKLKEVRQDNVENFNMSFTNWYDEVEISLMDLGLRFKDSKNKRMALKLALIGILYLVFGAYSMYSGITLGIIPFIISFVIMFICLYYLGRIPREGNAIHKYFSDLKGHIEALGKGKTNTLPTSISKEEVFLYGYIFGLDYTSLKYLVENFNIEGFEEFFIEQNSQSKMEIAFNEALFGTATPGSKIVIFNR